jgi:multiple antibiotic resistance protein
MADALSGFVRAVLLGLAALLPIINPLGQAPIFLSMTPGASEAARASLAGRIARSSFVLLAASMLVGSYVLSFFGLSLPVVKIAGGLLVISTAWQLTRADGASPAAVVPAAPPEESDGVSFYPLTFPITVGPGTLSVALTLGAGVPLRDVASVAPLLGALVGLLLVSYAIYLSYTFAARILRAVGKSGTVVLLRLSAFILLAIGVQILCDGLEERFMAPR